MEYAPAPPCPRCSCRRASSPAIRPLPLACRHSLAPHEWHVYADVDEHFDYPCELRRALSRADAPRGECVRGFLYDQLAADGNISAMSDAPSLVQQFPLQCNVHGLSPGVMNSKHILVRAGGGGGLNRTTHAPLHPMRYRSTHAVSGAVGCSGCCLVGQGLIRHYTMTAQNMRSMWQKASLQHAQLANGSSQTALWTPCGSVDARTGHCRDYEHQYKWMAAQVARRAVAPSARPPPSVCAHSLETMVRLGGAGGTGGVHARAVHNLSRSSSIAPKDESDNALAAHVASLRVQLSEPEAETKLAARGDDGRHHPNGTHVRHGGARGTESTHDGSARSSASTTTSSAWSSTAAWSALLTR